MEVRRRHTGGATTDAGIEDPGWISSSGDGEEAYREGLHLYSQAEKSSFEDTDILTKSIKRVITASEQGVEKASVWMKDFLETVPALPSSVALPDNLLRTMEYVSEATPTELQVRQAAKSMFQKMAGGHGAISREEISEKAKDLLQSEDAAPLKKSSRMLEQSIHRLCNDAIAINKTDKVGVNYSAVSQKTYN